MSEEKVEREAYADPPGADQALTVGGLTYDGAQERWTWSTEVYRIHGFEPHDVVPTTQLMLFHAHPDDREALGATLDRVVEVPGACSVHFRLVDAGGTTRRVLLMGRSEPVDGSDALDLRAELVDLTGLQQEILNADLGSMVDDFRVNRAVIEQAKGVIIQMFAVDADEAFDHLRAASQQANVKVRVLAQYIVKAAELDRTPAKGSPGLDLAEVWRVLSAARAD
jgi:hypothetical protein